MTASSPEVQYGYTLEKARGIAPSGVLATVWLSKVSMQQDTWLIFMSTWDPGWEGHNDRESAYTRYRYLVSKLTDATPCYGGS